MRVLLLGYSDIGRRRILPALAGLGLERVDIASESKAGAAAWPAGLHGRVFGRYDEAIAAGEADLVWISTVNSRHAALAEQALEAGRHVVVDKPATLALADTRRLADLARRKGLLLAEATVYPFHPQVAAARKVFADAGSAPAQIVAAFSIPPLPPADFRYDPVLGGGMMADLGPYAASLGRVFFDAAPREVLGRSLAGGDAFSLVMTYDGERSVTGHFGATTGYANRLTLLGPRVVLTMDRAFSTPVDMTCRLQAAVADQPVTVEVAAADSFARFFAEVRAAIQAGDPGRFLDAMLADAEALDRLRRAAAP